MDSQEFLRWHYFLKKWQDEEIRGREKWETYAAEIVMYLFLQTHPKIPHKKRAKLRLEKFLHKFVPKRPKRKESSPEPQEVKGQSWREQKAILTATMRTLGAKTGPTPGEVLYGRRRARTRAARRSRNG